jgi:hypothetical protein
MIKTSLFFLFSFFFIPPPKKKMKKRKELLLASWEAEQFKHCTLLISDFNSLFSQWFVHSSKLSSGVKTWAAQG